MIDSGRAGVEVPLRQVRARFDAETVTVYQAYSRDIAAPAVAAGTFVAPFKMERMTWIKPSFLWMMYRSGWASKPGQERVLAIQVTRSGFDEALASACLSHYERDVHGDFDDWRRRLDESPVRVQWDPERSVRLEQLPYRAIQIGLSREAVRKYVWQWIVGISDVTDLAHSLHGLVKAGEWERAQELLPVETPYAVEPVTARRLGMNQIPV